MCRSASVTTKGSVLCVAGDPAKQQHCRRELPSRPIQTSLTQNLVQLHNGRIGANAVYRLRLLGRGVALLKDLLILVARVVGCHGESIERASEVREEEGKGNRSAGRERPSNT